MGASVPFVPAVAAATSAQRRATPTLVLVAAVVTPLGATTANAALTVTAVWTLVLILALLLRFGEPPVLAFAGSLQWFSVTVPILFANASGRPLGEAEGMPTMATAAWLGLGTVLVLAIGMRWGRGARGVTDLRALRQIGAELSPGRLLLTYLVTLIIAHVMVPAMTQLAPGLRQPISALSALPMLVAFVILWCAAISPRTRALAVLVVVANIVIGFGQYFSGFKALILLALVVLSGKARSLRDIIGRPVLWSLTTLLVLLVSFWSAVKMEYRAVLNAGSRAQVVLVSPAERFAFLRNRAATFRTTDLERGLELSLARIGYLDFFAGSIATVPSRLPHTDGRLWGETVTHVLSPRVLSPDKLPINDSDRTNMYSGFRVATADQGASVSIGYAGESYIDFGPVGMFIPILLLGTFWGWGYRLLATAGPVPLLNAAAATVFILPGATLFESSNLKLVGGAVTMLLVLYPFLRYVSGPFWFGLMAPRGQREHHHVA